MMRASSFTVCAFYVSTFLQSSVYFCEHALISLLDFNYLDQIIFTSVVDIICEEDEGNGDDELTTDVISDDDEILRVCHTLQAM